MSCSSVDLKAYVFGEEAGAVENHLRSCQSCREELERLRATQTAMMTLPEVEIPQRIAFVSDKVFEPRWWQVMWRSGPAMGFASAALLACAILVHAFTRPATVITQVAMDKVAIEREVNARVEGVVAKAVSDAEARQAAQFAEKLDVAEKRFEEKRQADMATVQQAARYYEQQTARLMVAVNESRGGGQ